MGASFSVLRYGKAVPYEGDPKVVVTRGLCGREALVGEVDRVGGGQAEEVDVASFC